MSYFSWSEVFVVFFLYKILKHISHTTPNNCKFCVLMYHQLKLSSLSWASLLTKIKRWNLVGGGRGSRGKTIENKNEITHWFHHWSSLRGTISEHPKRLLCECRVLKRECTCNCASQWDIKLLKPRRSVDVTCNRFPKGDLVAKLIYNPWQVVILT